MKWACALSVPAGLSCVCRGGRGSRGVAVDWLTSGGVFFFPRETSSGFVSLLSLERQASESERVYVPVREWVLRFLAKLPLQCGVSHRRGSVGVQYQGGILPPHTHPHTQTPIEQGELETQVWMIEAFLVFGAATKCAMCYGACLHKLQKLICSPLYKLCA